MQTVSGFIVALIIASAPFSRTGQTQSAKPKTVKTEFNIFSGDEIIGHATASKITAGKKTSLDLKISTQSKIMLMEILVESEINLVYTNNTLIKGVAIRVANRGNENVQSSIVKTDKHNYTIKRNGKTRTLKADRIDFCVVDLYFTEPKKRKVVFSTMYGHYLELVPLGDGKYRTRLPDNKDAVYIYKNGRLESVEVDLPLGKAVTRRI